MDNENHLLEIASNDAMKNIHESTFSFETITQPELDSMGDKFPPSMVEDEEFWCPQFDYNDWVASEDHSIMFNDVGGSIWDESFELTSSDCQPQTRVCDPLDYDPIFLLWDS